jgi:hypothetical protein
MPDICPSVFYLRLSPPLNSIDTFDRFEIKDGRNLTYVANIKTNTVITTSVRLLCCHHVKTSQNNYCAARKNTGAHITACSICTKWTHFHLSPVRNTNVADKDYLLSFVENSDFSASIPGILEEQINIVKTLDITRCIQYYIFMYGEPAFETSNNSHRDKIFDEAINTTAQKKGATVIPHPSKDNCKLEKIYLSAKNDLSFSLNNKQLVFHSS